MLNAALYGTVALEPRALIRRRDDRAFEPVRTLVCSLSTLTGGKDATASRPGSIRVLRDGCARSASTRRRKAYELNLVAESRWESRGKSPAFFLHLTRPDRGQLGPAR